MYLYITAGMASVLTIIFSTLLIGIDFPLSMVYKYFHSNSETLKQALFKNDARTTKALDYIYSLGELAREVPEVEINREVDILVVVVTVSREREPRSEKTGYLLQTVATMDKLMKVDHYFPKKLMFVCNVDQNPVHHTEAKELQNYFSFIQKGGATNLGLKLPNIPELKGSGLVDEARKQEIIDYTYCLNVSLSFNYKYALFLEDDVIPRENLFEVLHHTLKYRLLNHRLDHGNLNKQREFSFLKLYYPERWQGYAFEIDRILELLSIGCLGGTFFVIIASYFDVDTPRSRKSKSSALPTFLLGFLCFIVVAKIFGRVNVIEIRHLTPYFFKFGPSSACCSQALLYRREIVPSIARHLLINNSLNKDLAIYDFSQKYAMPGYQLEPNLFMHTGMTTSLSFNIKDPEEFLFDLFSLE